VTAGAGLDDPLVLPCGAVLPNRLVKAAMSEQLADRRNDVSAPLVHLYRQWSRSGCGLLITGNMMVDRCAISEPRQVVVEHGRDTRALTSLATAAKEHGASVWAQLNHGGRQVPRFLSRDATAPSEVPVRAMGAFGVPRALTSIEIDDIIGRFATAAAMAVAAGFDGVQLHGAHGYLISQFLSPLANRRDDDWGGTPQRRRRLLLETVRAVRAAVGPHVPVGVKLNSADFQRGGFDEDESMQAIEALERAGVDLLEISGGTFETGAMMGARLTRRTQAREAYFLHFAEAVRERTGLPLMVTGGFRTAAAMVEAVRAGTVDLVGLARPLAVEPTFGRQLLAGTSTGAQLPSRHLASKRLDALAEVAWYTRQLRRLSRGRATRPGAGVRRALAAYLAATAAQTVTRNRKW
jgi:2,4-dienoyl-CoA reductase-like NADH-dependent reductase (Old Yellow Enzyme family)